MDQETELLLRLAANHLYLAQFEPLRAIILTLRSKTPNLSVAVLQSIVANSGRFQNVLWSDSCPNPSLLTYLSTLELMQFDDACSAWSFDAETLKLRVEFLLYVQILCDRVSDRVRNVSEVTSVDTSDNLEDVNSELDGCVHVLAKVLALGVRRLRADVAISEGVGSSGGVDRVSSDVASIEETELVCLRKVIWEYPDIFDALCWNVHRQLQGWNVDDSGLALAVHRDENVGRNFLLEEEDMKVMGFMRKRVQLSHLDAIRECVKDVNEDGAIKHVRFLHLDHGVEETEYQ